MRGVSKVAHVMRRFTLNKWGGTETVVFNLSREFVNMGIESPIFCTNMFSKTGTEEVEGVRIKRYPYSFPWIGLGKQARDALRLKGGSPLTLRLFFELLLEKDLSLIHTHVQHRLGGIARTVAKLKGIPYVVSIHGGYFTLPKDQVRQMVDPFRGKPEWGKIFGFLFGSRRVVRDASAIVCVGRNEYEKVSRKFPDKKVFYLPNGVHTSKFEHADPNAFRKAQGFDEQTSYILCLSRIDYQKNQLLLVRSFARFLEKHPDYKLVLIGPVTVEAYQRSILSEIEKEGIQDNVIIIPGLNPNDPLLQSAYKGADMFVLPTSHEPFGIVILEAWASKTPVIATRIGGIPGFSTDEENILHFEDNDEEMLLRQITRLAENKDLCSRIANAGYEEVRRKYDWSMLAKQMLSIYEEVRNI